MNRRRHAERKVNHWKFKNIPHPLLSVSAMVCVAVNTAKADNTVPTVMMPPAHTALRYDEDYSYLKNPEIRTNLYDKLKYIPLNKQGDWYLTFGGELRDRYEYFNNYTFGTGPQTSAGYNLIRAMFDADVHLSPYFRVFAEGISATEQGRNGGPRPTDVNEIDDFQAFADLILPLTTDMSFTLRGGRQVIVLGAQRLIGVSDFTNVRRTDDGLRGTLTMPGDTLDMFYARPVRVLPYELDDDISGTFFTGIYNTWKVPGELAKVNTTWEAYGIYVKRESNTFNKTRAGERRFTFGSRLTSNPKPFDFDLEADYQLGDFDSQTTHSFSVATIGGYTLEKVMFTPRAFLGFDIASGGNSNNPGDVFDQLFPSGHDQFGIIDAIGRQNIIDVHPGVTLTLLQNKSWIQRLTLLAQYRQFWRESAEDAVYTASGTVLRASGGSGARDIGGEVDTQVNWQLDRYFSAYAGYCHFFHGPFIAETGPANDIDFAYTAMTVTF